MAREENEDKNSGDGKPDPFGSKRKSCRSEMDADGLTAPKMPRFVVPLSCGGWEGKTPSDALSHIQNGGGERRVEYFVPY